MSGRDSELEEASGFSDLSDSEFLQIEEPELQAPANPSCSGIRHLESKGDDEAQESMSETGKRKRDQTPLEAFRLRYLTVTQITAQVWCEQQMVFKREIPDLQVPEAAAVLDAGKSIHLARELEDHDLVTVCITSREDSWAIRLFNLLLMIRDLKGGRRVREFPVFGVLEGVFVVGIIDQLSYTAKGELELHELKTRKEPSMPSAAQKKRDQFQVCLYKYIFDAMVQGQLTQDSFSQHLHLRPNQALGPHVQEQVRNAGFTASCFRDLLELTFLNLTLSDIPIIDRLQIEYIHQETSALLGKELLAYNKDTMSFKLQYFLAYWKGQRDPKGVDIEDAWKCRYCVYSDICDWRLQKSPESGMQGNEHKKHR
ncbi:hypothetical protein lerEdw1_001784 [Lerista edwardsae]|nr:hypothetical protein lerEdw1_001784 [Lerista edwardsae]